MDLFIYTISMKHFHLLSFTFIYFHLTSFIFIYFIYFYLLSSTFIYFQLLSSIYIIPSSILSSTFIWFHKLENIFLHKSFMHRLTNWCNYKWVIYFSMFSEIISHPTSYYYIQSYQIWPERKLKGSRRLWIRNILIPLILFKLDSLRMCVHWTLYRYSIVYQVYLQVHLSLWCCVFFFLIFQTFFSL